MKEDFKTQEATVGGSSTMESERISKSEVYLQHLLAEARSFSGEYPQFLANHLPMMLVALHRLGATEKRLADCFEHYRDAHGLVAMADSNLPIDAIRWKEGLGDRSREGDYRLFLTLETERLGIDRVLISYLPDLLPGLAASAMHGLMRLAYGVYRSDEQEVGAALGYWASTFLMLGETKGSPPITADPAEVLVRLSQRKGLADVKVELDLLWHFMRAVSRKPEFAPVVDWLAIVPDSLERIARASLVLYTGSLDFCALHALTGAHWIRMITPLAPRPDLIVRYFWQAIAALYPKMGFPGLPSKTEVDEWRSIRAPDWDDIASAACRSNDEHDISLVFSAREEWKHYRDPLYRVAAAKRLQLIE